MEELEVRDQALRVLELVKARRRRPLLWGVGGCSRSRSLPRGTVEVRRDSGRRQTGLRRAPAPAAEQAALLKKVHEAEEASSERLVATEEAATKLWDDLRAAKEREGELAEALEAERAAAEAARREVEEAAREVAAAQLAQQEAARAAQEAQEAARAQALDSAAAVEAEVASAKALAAVAQQQVQRLQKELDAARAEARAQVDAARAEAAAARKEAADALRRASDSEQRAAVAEAASTSAGQWQIGRAHV